MQLTLLQTLPISVKVKNTMSHSIKPRRIPPVQVGSWIKDAADLVRRAFVPFFLLNGGCMVIAWLARGFIPYTAMVMAVSFLMGIVIARAVDVEILPTLPALLRQLAMNIRMVGEVAIIWVGAAWSLLILILPKDFFGTLTHELAQQSGAWQQIVMVGAGSYVLFHLVYGRIFPGDFQFHLKLVFGFAGRASIALGRGGRLGVNCLPLLLADLACLAVFLPCLLYAGLALPIALSFSSAISYVAFREIYLGAGGNRRLATSTLIVKGPAV